MQCGKCHALSCTSRRWSRCRVSAYSLAHHIWCDLRTRSCAARHRREPHRCTPYSRTVAVNCSMPACCACCTRAPDTNSEVLPASTLHTRLLSCCGAPALFSATSCGPSGMDSSRRALPAAVRKGGPERRGWRITHDNKSTETTPRKKRRTCPQQRRRQTSCRRNTRRPGKHGETCPLATHIRPESLPSR